MAAGAGRSAGGEASGNGHALMFESKLLTLLKTAFGTVQKDGFSDVALADAERRLGVALPRTLREFYSLAGQLPEVMTSHHQFVKVDTLNFIRDGLVFCHENQRQMFWAILKTDLAASMRPNQFSGS